MRPRKRGQLGPSSAEPRLETRPCPRCPAPTDADGRCAACRVVLATPTGGEPWRTCPEHRTRTLAADGWCNPQRAGGRDVWHVAGPRLERDGAVYVERAVPVPLPKAEVRQKLGALVDALAKPIPRVTATDVATAEHGDAWEPPAPHPADRFLAAGRAALARRQP